MKILGVDFGEKKIGIAIGDTETKLAFPIKNVEGGIDAVTRVALLRVEEGAEAIVVGVPIPTEEHQRLDAVTRTMDFVRALRDAAGVPVFTIDEQFSSAEARRLQHEKGYKEPEDAVAAMIILQAYLDEHG